MSITEIKHIKLWQLVIPLLAAANIAYLLHNPLGWIITLGFFLYVPGYLLLKATLGSQRLDIGRISLSIGLSLALLTITGLLLNSTHIFGVARPMEVAKIFASIDLMTLILLLISRNNSIDVPKHLPTFVNEEKLFIGLFTLLPVLSVFGAIRLNNGASNILTMVMIAMTGLLFIMLMIRPTVLRVYPYLIFMTALAILFSISLRGWSTTGHDIHHEFNVFNVVMRDGYWSPKKGGGDPYNACLSITLLPTILAKITAITPIYVYKVIFQIVFAAIVPTLYFFARKFISDKKALLGIFAFMTFPTFINDLPFLNRQEVAFGYFILILYVNFLKISYQAKSSLTVFLLMTIILSHYSTSYVTISILLLTLTVYKVLSSIYKNTARLSIPLLSLPIIIMAFLATFVWNVQVTSSSSNLSNTLTSAANGITGKDEAVVGSSSLAPNTKKLTSAEVLADKAASLNAEATLSPAELVPITSFGRQLSKVTNVTTLNNNLHTIVALTLQLFVVLGAILLLLHYFKTPPNANEVYILSIGCSFLVALALFTFVPQLSVGYDVTRLFQQSLTVLWMPVLFFFGTAFFWLGKYKNIASAGILVLLFFYLSGFGPRLTGGYLPNLALNNSGLYYDFFYTHSSDEIASKWLGDPTNKRIGYMTVFTDINSASPPLKYPVALGLTNGKPQGYYYTDYANNNTGKYRTILSTGFAEYTTDAFTENKSLIYSNSESKVYFTWPQNR